MDLPEPKNKMYRQWTLIALRALDQLGGLAAPIKIESAIRATPKNPLSDLQWARVIKGKYLRWAKIEFKKLGYVGGTGEWKLTDLGRQYLEAHKDDDLEWPTIAPLDPKSAGQLNAPLETVDATDFVGYEIPILRELSKEALSKKELIPRLLSTLNKVLLPGDRRTMNTGDVVARYRTSWSLSNLKKSGQISNPTIGKWEITGVGRERLERDEAQWDISAFQDSKAKVRAEWVDDSGALKKSTTIPPAVVWPTLKWTALRKRFSEELLSAFEQRVRPDLGASPNTNRPLLRNVILYGAPGTGKTFVARAVAEALTDRPDPNPNDRAWSIVQFHPSYSYEDFIQGLRPALEHRELRYQIQKGPFLQICDAAEKDPDRFFVLVIDEINRGDPARIFGELLYALEYRDESVDLALGGQLSVPSNLVVIGTMNSVDRSVALVDYALRRRFAFIRVEPDSEVIEHAYPDEAANAQVAARVLETFNDWIESKLDREHVIGHSFFLNAAYKTFDLPTLNVIWTNDVLPLLEEYFFGRQDVVDEAARVWSNAINEVPDEEDDEAPATSTAAHA